MIINIVDNGKILKERCDLELPDFTVLTGENGSGKTQLLMYLHSYSSMPGMYSPIFFPNHNQHPNNIVNKHAIYNNEGKALSQVIYSYPGLKNSEHQYFTEQPLIHQIKQEWDRLKPVTVGYHLIKDNSYTDDQAELHALNRSLVELTQSLSNDKSRFNSSNVRQIDIQELQKLKKISLQSSKSIDNLNYIDYLAFYEVPTHLFSASLDLLFHQFFLKQKYYPDLTDKISPPWVVFNEILDKANFKYEACYTPSSNEEFPVPVKLIDKQTSIDNATFDTLSSGEKTIMALIFVLYHSSSMGKFPEVILFDEPDAHLHPSLTQLFLSVIQEVLVKEQKVKVILTTHSPSTIALAPPESIYSMSRDLGYPIKEDPNTAVQSLSNGLATISIEEGNMGLHHTLKNVDKDILFTEGITDKIIIEIAWQKLYGCSSMPFFIQDCFSASFLGTLFNQGDQYPDGIFHQYPEKKLIALFDFDNAGYTNWNRGKKFSYDLIDDPSQCLLKSNGSNGYLLLLPVSKHEPIRSLAMKNIAETFKEKSTLTIESLFLNVQSIKEQFFQVETVIGGGSIYTFNGNKRKFTETIKNLDVDSFSEFIPLFDQINNIVKKE